MNKSIKQKWLKALRSGEYEQGKNRFVTPEEEYDRFCCLGVLVNETEGFDFIDGNYYADGYPSMLSDRFLKEIGLTYGQQADLVTMNDLGKSFKQIADYIEKNL